MSRSSDQHRERWSAADTSTGLNGTIDANASKGVVMAWLPTLITAVLALVGTIAVALFTARSNRATAQATAEQGRELARLESQIEVRKEIDLDLRGKREAKYLDLWKLGELMPKWPRNTGLTVNDVKRLHVSLQTWYFGGGGMYLSKSARAAYGDLQEQIDDFLSGHPTTIDAEQYESMRDRFSLLRTQLTDDLQSRDRNST